MFQAMFLETLPPQLLDEVAAAARTRRTGVQEEEEEEVETSVAEYPGPEPVWLEPPVQVAELPVHDEHGLVAHTSASARFTSMMSLRSVYGTGRFHPRFCCHKHMYTYTSHSMVCLAMSTPQGCLSIICRLFKMFGCFPEERAWLVGLEPRNQQR